MLHVYYSCQTRARARAVLQGPIIETYEGPQGPGTMLLKSGTVPEIRGPLRPMPPAKSLNVDRLVTSALSKAS